MRPTQAGVRSLKSANSISQSLSSKAQKPKGKKANLLAQELSKANQPKFKGLRRRTATLDLYGLPANTPLASIIEGIDQNSIYKIVPELDKGKLKLKFWDRKQSVNVAQHLYDTKYKAWTESGAKVIIPHKYGHSVPHSAIAPIFARNASRQVILPTIPGVSVTQRFTNASKFGPIETEMDQTTGNMKIRYMSFVDALKAVNDMPEARFPEPESDVSPKPDDVDASQFVRLWAPLPDAQISPELTDDKLKKDFGVFGGVTGVKWAENKQHLELEFPELRLASRAIDFSSTLKHTAPFRHRLMLNYMLVSEFLMVAATLSKVMRSFFRESGIYRAMRASKRDV
ncbi:hypothetical protein C8J56DRAFT_956493, partial [Mycena floridula]